MLASSARARSNQPHDALAVRAAVEPREFARVSVAGIAERAEPLRDVAAGERELAAHRDALAPAREHAVAAGDDAAHAAARMRIVRERRVLHALPGFEGARLLAVTFGDRFADVDCHYVIGFFGSFRP